MRTINYTIGVDSISPSTVQFAGFAGEDNATTLQFSFDDKLAVVIAGYDVVHYLLEVRDSSGVYNAYPLQLVTLDGEPPLSFEVPRDITLLSGKVILQLSIVKLDGDNNQERKLFTYPVRLRFSSSASGGVSGSSEYEQYHTGVVGAMVRAAAARDAAEKFAADADTAQKDALASKEAAATAEANAKSAAAMAAAERVAAEKAASEVAATANDAADRAAASEVAAGNYANSSDLFKTMAKRYAIGGTGVEEGEDTDNAKYYCERANIHQEAASKYATDADNHAKAAKQSENNAALYEQSALGYTNSAGQCADNAFTYKEEAKAAAERAEAAATEEVWVELASVTLDEANTYYSEQIELLGDTTKGVRARVTLPANTALPNNRLTAEINLSGNRQIVVRGEGIVQSAVASACCFEVSIFAGVWNVQVAPYVKSVGSVTGDLTHVKGDKVRYLKLQANNSNPIPAGTKIELWRLN